MRRYKTTAILALKIQLSSKLSQSFCTSRNHVILVYFFPLKISKHLTTYDSNALESVDGCAKEQRQLPPRGKCRSSRGRWQIMQHVVKDYAKADDCEDGCEQRHRSEIFETLDPIEYDHRQKQQQQVDSDIEMHQVVGHHFLQICGHKHKVHTAKTKLSDAQKYVDQTPEIEAKSDIYIFSSTKI